jgi:hypothetical protein
MDFDRRNGSDFRFGAAPAACCDCSMSDWIRRPEEHRPAYGDLVRGVLY